MTLHAVTRRAGWKAAVAAAAAASLVVGFVAVAASSKEGDGSLAEIFGETSRDTEWELTKATDLAFDAFHPQGLVRIGDRFYLSSVEIIEQPEPFDEPRGGFDRSPGRGVGHLFVFDRSGHLIDDVDLGRGHMYHPGGIDFDGRWLWVPVAQYRPDSRAIVYRVDPDNLKATEVFRVKDHIGGIVRDRVSGHLFGLTWGSRTFHEWTAGGDEIRSTANPSHFVDYQDCDYVPNRKMLCGGIAELRSDETAPPYELGGLALLDLRSLAAVHEVPFADHSPAGHVGTRNPVVLEATPAGLRLYAAPDDDPSAALLVYEAAAP